MLVSCYVKMEPERWGLQRNVVSREEDDEEWNDSDAGC